MLRRRQVVGRIGELSQKAGDTSPEKAWRPALPPCCTPFARLLGAAADRLL